MRPYRPTAHTGTTCASLSDDLEWGINGVAVNDIDVVRSRQNIRRLLDELHMHTLTKVPKLESTLDENNKQQTGEDASRKSQS